MPYTLTAIGCGTMAVAVLSGLIEHMSTLPADASADSKDVYPSKFIGTVKSQASAEKLRKTFEALPLGETAFEVTLADNNAEVIKQADVVLLGCKPYLAEAILNAPGIKAALEGKLLVSVLAGITVSTLKGWVPESCTVARAMPNTPAKIREGVVAVTPLDEKADSANVARNKTLEALFKPCGLMRFMEEKHFDAITALCGSGPAFVFLLIEALADGGLLQGLPRADALALAAQTVQGAAAMVVKSGQHPAVLKDQVTTPGGTTIAGLQVLEDRGVRSALIKCVQVAAEKATAMGKK